MIQIFPTARKLTVLTYGIRCFQLTNTRGCVIYTRQTQFAEYIPEIEVIDAEVKQLLQQYQPDREVVLSIILNSEYLSGIVDSQEVEANLPVQFCL